jgi:hypothetical protein
VDPLIQIFDERRQEIDAFLDLLDALERQVSGGVSAIGGVPITAQQQRILYSSVYLQLYNLVEATATWCMEAVAKASADGRWRPGDLSDELRKEWVRTTARTHIDLNAEHRFATAVSFCDLLIRSLPISDWSIEKGGGGNWDDLAIEAMTDRIGCELSVSKPVRTAVKQIVREDKGTLELVKYFRNQLAHGKLSFAECGDGVTVADLKDTAERAANYLREVIAAFQAYIDGHKFIVVGQRPHAGTHQ